MRECFAKGAYVQPLFGVTKGCIYATPFPHQVAQVSNGGFARNFSSIYIYILYTLYIYYAFNIYIYIYILIYYT